MNMLYSQTDFYLYLSRYTSFVPYLNLENNQISYFVQVI